MQGNLLEDGFIDCLREIRNVDKKAVISLDAYEPFVGYFSVSTIEQKEKVLKIIELYNNPLEYYGEIIATEEIKIIYDFKDYGEFLEIRNDIMGRIHKIIQDGIVIGTKEDYHLWGIDKDRKNLFLLSDITLEKKIKASDFLGRNND